MRDNCSFWTGQKMRPSGQVRNGDHDTVRGTYVDGRICESPGSLYVSLRPAGPRAWVVVSCRKADNYRRAGGNDCQQKS